MIQASKVLRRRLKMLTKRYLILMGRSRRLTTTQKLQRLKTRCRVLLITVTTAALNAKATEIGNNK